MSLFQRSERLARIRVLEEVYDDALFQAKVAESQEHPDRIVRLNDIARFVQVKLLSERSLLTPEKDRP